jgi:hypothetical protein
MELPGTKYTYDDQSETSGYGYGGQAGLTLGPFALSGDYYSLKGEESRGYISKKLTWDLTAVFGNLGVDAFGYRISLGYAPNVTGHLEMAPGNGIPVAAKGYKLSIGKQVEKYFAARLDFYDFVYDTDQNATFKQNYNKYSTYGVMASFLFPLEDFIGGSGSGSSFHTKSGK